MFRICGENPNDGDNPCGLFLVKRKRLIVTLQSYMSFFCLLVRFAFIKCNFDVSSAHDVRSFGKSLSGLIIPLKEVLSLNFMSFMNSGTFST